MNLQRSYPIIFERKIFYLFRPISIFGLKVFSLLLNEEKCFFPFLRFLELTITLHTLCDIANFLLIPSYIDIRTQSILTTLGWREMFFSLFAVPWIDYYSTYAVWCHQCWTLWVSYLRTINDEGAFVFFEPNWSVRKESERIPFDTGAI